MCFPSFDLPHQAVDGQSHHDTPKGVSASDRFRNLCGTCRLPSSSIRRCRLGSSCGWFRMMCALTSLLALLQMRRSLGSLSVGGRQLRQIECFRTVCSLFSLLSKPFLLMNRTIQVGESVGKSCSPIRQISCRTPVRPTQPLKPCQKPSQRVSWAFTTSLPITSATCGTTALPSPLSLSTLEGTP